MIKLYCHFLRNRQITQASNKIPILSSETYKSDDSGIIHASFYLKEEQMDNEIIIGIQTMQD